MPEVKKWSRWGKKKVITGELISAFAVVTDNRQWIHEDRGALPYENPYGERIAHGLLLVSLIPSLLPTDKEDKQLPPHTVKVIRGIDRLRLPSPVYPGQSVHIRTRHIATYPAASGKGTVIEREVEVWAKAGKKPAVSCILKLQYF